MSNLLKCCHCDNHAFIYEDSDTETDDKYHVHCGVCGCGVKSKSQRSAIINWNKRYSWIDLWDSVNEEYRWPMSGQTVWINVPSLNEVAYARFARPDHDNPWCYYGSDVRQYTNYVTHWMPAPSYRDSDDMNFSGYLPCSHCGNAALHGDDDDENGRHFYLVECVCCGAYTKVFTSEDDGRNNWNRRTGWQSCRYRWPHLGQEVWVFAPTIKFWSGILFAKYDVSSDQDKPWLIYYQGEKVHMERAFVTDWIAAPNPPKN